MALILLRFLLNLVTYCYENTLANLCSLDFQFLLKKLQLSGSGSDTDKEHQTTPTKRKMLYETPAADGPGSGSGSSGRRYVFQRFIKKTITEGLHSRGTFIRHGAESHGEDPFMSPTRGPYKPPQARARNSASAGSSPGTKSHAAWTDPNWRVGKSSSSPTSVNYDLGSKSGSSSSRVPLRNLSGENAQAFLPPSACVFVAK